jgi:hypothetical protein
MTQMQNAQSVALRLEKVRDKLPLLYERDDILLTMIQQRVGVRASAQERMSRVRRKGKNRRGGV